MGSYMADDSAFSVGDCLPKTSSTSLTESVTAIHDFKVTSYSLLDGMGVGKFVSSSTFSVGGYDWNLNFYPDGNRAGDKAAYASAFLYFRSGATGVRVKFVLSLLDKNGKVSELANSTTLTYTFQIVGSGWGLSQFVEKSKLQPLLCLNDDCFTIRCVLTVIKGSRSEDGVSSVIVPQSNLHQHFECMLKDGEGADVTFAVGGQQFHAHRCVLASRSPVFQAELFGPMMEKGTQCIKIDDMEPKIFEALLHFIYTDSLPDSCEDGKTAGKQHLLVAADRYGLDRLRLMCESKLSESMDVETVATTLALAEQHHCSQLREACIGFIASRNVLGAVMGTDGFKHLVACCPLVMKDILDKVARVWT